MKTLLIIDKSLGLARSHLVKKLLGAAAAKADLTLTDKIDESELAIALGGVLSADSALNGKKRCMSVMLNWQQVSQNNF